MFHQRSHLLKRWMNRSKSWAKHRTRRLRLATLACRVSPSGVLCTAGGLWDALRDEHLGPPEVLTFFAVGSGKKRHRRDSRRGEFGIFLYN